MGGLCPFNNGIDGGIHWANDVGDPFSVVPGEAALISGDGAFVVQDATGVESAYPTAHCVVVGAITAFVSKRPHNDTGVIFVAVNEPDCSV